MWQKKANAELEEFDFENREQVTEEIIDKVLLSYKERRGADCASEERVELNLMEEAAMNVHLQEFSEGSLKEFLGGMEAACRSDRTGDIKGVAGV